MANPKRKRGRPPATEDRRESIMDAALHCFVERGFYGTTIPHISKRAGIAAGTIYHYFVSKEGLVNAVYRKWKNEVGRRVLMNLPQGAPARKQFQAMWQTMFVFANEHPEAFAFLELHHHASYLDAESMVIQKNLKDFATQLVRGPQEQGILKSMDPTLLTELVFGAFNGMMRAHWELGTEITPEDAQTAEQACWDALASHATECTCSGP